MKVKSLSRVRLPATPWTAVHQVPPSMGFSRQEYWSGVPLPSPDMSHIDLHIYSPQVYPLRGLGEGSFTKALQNTLVPGNICIIEKFYVGFLL